MEQSRRAFLCVGTSAGILTVIGCVDADTESRDEPIFDEGERLVTVTVSKNYTETVVVEADCREADVTVAPGERVRLHREEDGEECFVRLGADGEELFTREIWEYEAPELTVEENGDVDELEVER